MSASMTINITEDADPDGGVEVSFKVDGFEIEDARVDGDLPAAILLGAEMMKLADKLPGPRRVAPPARGQLPGRSRR